MSSCKTWRYPENETVKQFEKLFSNYNSISINTWYSIADGLTFIYENSKFYYHMATVKKNQLGYYLDDYVLSRKSELVYNTMFGYFKTKEELKEFIDSKTEIMLTV
jgi:hypothetical protein